MEAGTRLFAGNTDLSIKYTKTAGPDLKQLSLHNGLCANTPERRGYNNQPAAAGGPTRRDEKKENYLF